MESVDSFFKQAYAVVDLIVTCDCLFHLPFESIHILIEVFGAKTFPNGNKYNQEFLLYSEFGKN
jgi:hypothetical protein